MLLLCIGLVLQAVGPALCGFMVSQNICCTQRKQGKQAQLRRGEIERNHRKHEEGKKKTI